MKNINFPKLILSIIICLSAGAIGSIFTVSSIPTWYSTLNKPGFNPPNWIFGPVWTTLYIFMGISLNLVWQQKLKKSLKITAILWFVFQLILNSLWSIIFFGIKNPPLALVCIFILWYAIFQTMQKFYPLSKTAAYLLVPYLAWVSFATFLNAAIASLN